MGFKLKNLLKTPKFLRPVLGDTWLDEAGTVGGFIAGGPGGAAAGRGLGKFAATGDVKKGLMGAAEGYAAGAGFDALKGAGGVKALLSNPGKTAGTLVKKARAVGATPAAAGQPGVPGLLDKAFNFAKQNPMAVLGGLGMVSDARQQSRRNGMQDQALEMMKQRQAQQDELRAMLMGQLGGLDGGMGGGMGGGGGVPDLNDLFSTGSVYEKPVNMRPVGG